MLNKCIILKENYDNQLLLQDYNIAKKIEFTKRTYIKGSSKTLYDNTIGWHSIPLHTLNGKEVFKVTF